ncbi:MAG: hypothetical protein RBR15_15600 [Sphaerochaeta sp.]|nr:hypothetical protein [Sphaerochaeta sp.]
MNYTAIKEVCKAYSKAFDEVEELIIDWGWDNRSLQKSIREIYAQCNTARYPKEYGHLSVGNYFLSLVLTDSGAMAKLHAKHEAVLTAKARKVLSFWQESPAFWCYFVIKEGMKDDFLTIMDLLTGQEHLLYSRGVSGMQRSGDARGKHYLTLMFPNGECLQTAGIIRYHSLSTSDFTFYLDLFGYEGSLEGTINAHYSTFFMLDEIATLPMIMHRGIPMEYTWQEFTLDSFDIAALGGQWFITEKGDLACYSLDTPDTAMRAVPNGELLESDYPAMSFALYRNSKTGAMAINTSAKISYSIIASILKRSCPVLVLPEEPEVAISMALYSLLDRMKVDLPWSPFKAIMDYERKSDRAKPESEQVTEVNKLLKEYMHAQNTGKPFDDKAYSKRSGMPLEDVRTIIQSVEEISERNVPSYKVSAEDSKYELSGWPVPPPVTRRFFTDSLVGSKLFAFDEGPNTLATFEALTGGLYKDELFSTGLPQFIEGLFIEAFDDHDVAYALANAFFWLLFFKGKDWLPLRSYAIEILKLFSYPIGKLYPEDEEFIKAFSSFTRKQLCTRGICSLKARPSSAEVRQGTFLIKGSDGFYSLVEGVNAFE